MLIRLWERKFDLEIRGIDVYDINSDGLDEVVLASWDAKIYTVAHNKILWATKEQEFSGENVVIIKDSMGKPLHIVGSFHRELVCFNLNGVELWKLPFDSWIVRLLNIGPNRRGIDDILVVDLRGNIHLVDAEGKKLWSAEKAFSKDIAVDNSLYGLAIDKENQKIFLVDDKQIKVFSFDGNLQRKKPLTKKALSIALVKLLRQKQSKTLLAVGLKNEIIFLDPDTLLEESKTKLPRQVEAQVLYSADIDNDLFDEVIVGSWSRNAIIILKYDNTTKKFVPAKTFNIKGNPLFLTTHDLSGDYKEEIIVGTDENTVHVIAGLKEIYSIEAQVSFHGAKFANTIGYGSRDIILRGTKESLACYSFIPRIWYTLDNWETPKGRIYAITQSTTRLSTDKVLLVDNKSRRLSRRTINGKSIMFYEIPFKAQYRGRISEISIKKGKTILLRSFIPIPDFEKLTILTKSLALAEEDEIIIQDFQAESKDIYVDAEGIEIVNLTTQKGKIKLSLVRTPTNIFNAKIVLMQKKSFSKKKPTPQEYSFTVVPLSTLQVQLQAGELLSTKETITLLVKNNSGKEISFNIRSAGILNIRASGKLPPRSQRQIKLKATVRSDKLKIDARETISITYGDVLKRKILIPIRTTILNADRIAERAQRIYSATKDKNVVVRTLSEELGVSEDIIKRIIKL